MDNKQKTVCALFALGLGIGCGAAAPQGDGKPKEPSLQSSMQKIVNISAVDLGVCFPKAPALPEKINAHAMTGLLIAARPLVMECLVDPKNRGPADETNVSLETTLSAGKLTHAVSGTNLTPTGQTCITAAVDKFIATAPEWATKSAAVTTPVKVTQTYQHVATNMPAVKFGVSEASDATGAIRLAEASFCDCYAPWKDAEPTTLKASIKLKKGEAAVVTFDPSQDAAATQVAACLLPKVSALPLKTTAVELTAPYLFAFTNSMRDGLFTNATPDMAFMQYEAVRPEVFGASVVADGGRVVAAEADTAAVEEYKKKPGAPTLEKVQKSCDGLMAAHDGYIKALDKLLTLDEKALAMLTEFAAKDPAWAPVKEGAGKYVDQSKKDIDAAKAVRAEDDGMCAKRRPK